MRVISIRLAKVELSISPRSRRLVASRLRASTLRSAYAQREPETEIGGKYHK